MSGAFAALPTSPEATMADAAAQPSAGVSWTTSHAIYLEELAAIAGYASVVCITAAVTFVIADVGSGWVLRGSHLPWGPCSLGILVLMMVMKRVFALTQDRLNRAWTGAG